MTAFTRSDLDFDSQGVRCAGWLYRPETDSRLPAVVMAHGFTAVRDQRLPAYAEAFAAAGLVVLLFDYRHFGDSDGEPRQLLNVRRQLQDWEAAIVTVRKLPGVDPDRIALWGTSFGGAHAQSIAAEDHRIAAVVAQVPFCRTEKPQQPVPLGKTLRLLGRALRDALHGALGLSPCYIQAIGNPDEFAAMTSPRAADGIASLTPADSRWRNRVAARFVFQLANYKPGKQAEYIQCPIHYTIAEQDAFIRPETIREAAALAPRGETQSYDCGHFGVYVEPWFARVVADETAFLVRELGTDR
ncbi:alpha/beta hydrolase [Kineobactrum sediminis]|uniref:Alpha/beta hydrolase n=1 Tax=Kineobactrum sediminis TaxID=1905677 RepID=A0A2N5XZ02_9GAMM|nr:alpha/beta hydrolase [Kineobactrum sediminis]PLW81366.1 alpha/beta hydrolase [Kineobactrum sediminis]